MYRTAEIEVKRMKSAMSRTKIATDIQYSHAPLYGRLYSRIETMPVPMVMANHLLYEVRSNAQNVHYTEETYDGVKLRTILRNLGIQTFDGFSESLSASWRVLEGAMSTRIPGNQGSLLDLLLITTFEEELINM
jgi:hypothetical protein